MLLRYLYAASMQLPRCLFEGNPCVACLPHTTRIPPPHHPHTTPTLHPHHTHTTPLQLTECASKIVLKMRVQLMGLPSTYSETFYKARMDEGRRGGGGASAVDGAAQHIQ